VNDGVQDSLICDIMQLCVND